MQSNEFAGYVKDLKTGAILGISNKRCLQQIAMDNQELIKRGQKHAIEYEVLPSNYGINEPQEIETEKKQAGRPKTK